MFIEIKNLKKSYTTGVVKTEVLKEIGMKLDKGEIGVILGPSGSGKSTLMNILGGIDRSDSGQVSVDGVEINNLNDDSVFNLDELFAIYDSLMMMVKIWRSKFKEFSTEHPKSAKIKTKGTWAKKYYSRCFTLKKELRSKVISEDICHLAFSDVMGS